MASAGTAIIEFRGDFTSLQSAGRKASVDTEKSMLGSFKNIAKRAGPILAGVGAISVFKGMIDEAREAEKVSKVTANAIKVTGGVAHISAKQVGELSNAISKKAGIDDEAIQTGANLLLTFKNVRNEVGKGNDVFNKATQAATDLSVQYGSIDSASKMLGKALNDPLKGMAALGKAGVGFSEQQKEQIKNYVATGDLLSAQKVILKEVAGQVGGAAAAAADPIDKLKVAWGNLLEEAGGKVLPVMGDLATALADKLPNAISSTQKTLAPLIDKASSFAKTLWNGVKPAVGDVGDALGHLKDIAAEVIDFGRPVAEAFLLIGGAAVVGGIRGTAKALELVSGVLADNKWMVDSLVAGVVAFAALKAWGMIVSLVETIYLKWLYLQGAVTGSAILGGLKMIGAGFVTMGTDATVGAGMVKGGMATIASSTAFAVGALAVLAAAGIASWQGIQKAQDDAKKSLDDFKPKGFDRNSLQSWREYGDSLGAASKTTGALNQANDTFGGHVKDAIQLMTWQKNKITETRMAAEAYSAELEHITRVGVELEDKYRAVWEGVSGKKVTDGLDLTANNIGTLGAKIKDAQGWVAAFNLDPMKLSSEELTKEVQKHWKALADDAGYKGPQIKAAMELSPAELEAQKKQWETLSQAVSGAWSSQLDVVSALGGQADITKKQITDWYTLQAAQATTFGNNISTALQQGYDPALISRLLQAGPAQAAPLLQKMVDNHKNGLVDIVNQGEQALGRLSTLAVEMARIQNIAMNSQTDDMTRNMGLGMKEAEAVSRLGAFATADAIAHELGIGVNQVQDIAKMYGISLAGAVNPVLSAVGKPPISFAQQNANKVAKAFGRNSGGPIPGPNVDRDVVPAMLTPGEFVQRRSAVAKWGMGAMQALNAGQVPAGWSVPGLNAGGVVNGKTAGLRPEFMARLREWAGAVGQTYTVGSGYRSIDEQKVLYAKYLAGRGALAAVPGSSMHNFGLASDGNHWKSKNPGMFGLDFAVPGEAWHVQPTDARALRAGGKGGFIPMAGAGFATPVLPKPPAIGPWALAQGGEGMMGKAYEGALDWAKKQTMASPAASMGDIAGGSSREIGQRMAAARGWTGGQWSALDQLWNRESGWRANATNPTSSAYGIPQSLPGTKMASKGADWRTNPATQIAWGLDYIAGRYGDPLGAWAHSQKTGWYHDGGEILQHRRNFDGGGVLAEGWNAVRNDTGGPEHLVPAGRQAPLIENATFHEGVDVDVVLQKLTAQVAAGRL